MKKIAFIIITSFLLSSCVSKGLLKQDARLTSSDESVFVLGLSPENYSVFIFKGEIKNGRFDKNIFVSSIAYGTADNGYIVSKAPARETFAVTLISIGEKKDSISGTSYVPCRDAKTITFKAPAGKVIYLGDVEYVLEGGAVTTKYGNNFDAAEKYINDKYPHLRGKLEYQPYKLLPTTLPCSSTVTIPISLP